MALLDITIAQHARRATSPKARFSLMRALDVWRSRRALARLDSAALEDIGIDRARAVREAAKPIWDVPATWRQ